MLDQLGLHRSRPDGEHIAILVGPNGAGKSNFLKALAVDLRSERNTAVICNTAYDRFAGSFHSYSFKMSSGERGMVLMPAAVLVSNRLSGAAKTFVQIYWSYEEISTAPQCV